MGESRLGGEPDLPKGTTWPHVTCTKKDFGIAPEHFRPGTLPEPDAKGRYQVPLGFIAQLDLADLAAHDADGLLPTTGMLWFFLRQEITIGEQRERPVLASRVIYIKKEAGAGPYVATQHAADVGSLARGETRGLARSARSASRR